MNTHQQDYSPLRLGFIGGGMNSAIGSAHFAASMLDNRFVINSGCFSRDEAINRQTAQRWNIDYSLCSTDWQQYLAQANTTIDAVCILTPIPDHYDMLVAALNNGIPVICEKALVSNTAQALDLKARYADKPHFLAVTLNYSGYPVVRLLRDLIAKGRFGQVQQVHLEMPLENYTRIPVGQAAPSKPQLWRQTDESVPTLLLDLGVHLHHLLSFTTGAKVQNVMAHFNHFSTMPDIVDSAQILLDCDSGLQASMWMSKTALGNRNGMRIRLYGDKGAAEWVQFEPEVLHITDVHGVRSQIDRGVENAVLQTPHFNRFKAGHPSGYIEAFGNLYWDIADSLQNYRKTGLSEHPNVFGVNHAIDGLALLESAVESHRLKRWVAVTDDAITGDDGESTVNRYKPGGNDLGDGASVAAVRSDKAA